MTSAPFDEAAVRAEFEAETRATHPNCSVCERHPSNSAYYRIHDIQMLWRGWLAHARLSHDKIAEAMHADCERAKADLAETRALIADHHSSVDPRGGIKADWWSVALLERRKANALRTGCERRIAEAVMAEREAIALDMKTRAEAERISRDMARRDKNDEIATMHCDRALAFEHAAAAIRARKDAGR